MERVQIKISKGIYLKNPEESKLGRNILQTSVTLLDEVGFESFNFKKLAKEIGSTEASIYRYFENKHKLLVYLVSWYWNWIEYHFVFRSDFIKSPKDKLDLSIALLCKPIGMDPTYDHMDEDALYRVVINESVKVFLTKEVDKEEDQGYFKAYEKFCYRLAVLVLEINPNYKYPRALVSAMVEAAHNQKFFAAHMAPMTEMKNDNDRKLYEFLYDLVFKVISPK